MIGSNKDEQSLFLGHLPWVTGATFDNLPDATEAVSRRTLDRRSLRDIAPRSRRCPPTSSA